MRRHITHAKSINAVAPHSLPHNDVPNHQVYKGRRRCTGQITAMKFIMKHGKSEKDIKNLRQVGMRAFGFWGQGASPKGGRAGHGRCFTRLSLSGQQQQYVNTLQVGGRQRSAARLSSWFKHR